MGISTQLIIKALSNLLGESTKSIENKLAEVGDMGEISEELIKNNKQVTFFKVPLTVKKVLSNLRIIYFSFTSRGKIYYKNNNRKIKDRCG